MGTDKARLEVDGVALADRVAAALTEAGAREVLVIGAAEDRWPGEGPLAGLASALLAAIDRGGSDALVAVAGCDHPDLSPVLVGRLVDALVASPAAVIGAVARTEDGRLQPLPSVWRALAAPVLAGLVAAGERRASAAFAAGTIVEVDASTADLADVDTPEELAARRDRHRVNPEPPRRLPG